MRLAADDRAAFDSNGGTEYVRRLIREDQAGSKISRQWLLDWISQREAEHGPSESLAALRAQLET